MPVSTTRRLDSQERVDHAATVGAPRQASAAAAKVSATAISAVVSVSTPGVLPTGIPWRVAAVRSTLLKPTA